MKPLKIAVIVNVFPKLSETFIVNQITSLIDKGHEVKIFAQSRGDVLKVHKNIRDYDLLKKTIYKQKPSKNRIKRVLVFFKLLTNNLWQVNWKLLFKSLNYFKYGRRAINLKVFFERKFYILNKDFDLVHVHFAMNGIDVANYKAEGFLNNIKIIVSFHGFDINPSKIDYYQTYYKILFEQTYQFTVNTIYTKELLYSVNPVLENVTIIPESLDVKMFKKGEMNAVRDNVFRIVYCGRLVPFKGGNLLPLIMEELLSRNMDNIHLHIIGDGVLRQNIKAEIETRKLQRVITMEGALTQKEIKNIFENSNVFLLPGVYDKKDGRAENQGLVIQEAQAMELPVVVSDVGGMKYGMIPDFTGFVVKENDIAGFADAIESIYKDSLKAINMGKKGRKFVKENYSSEVLVDKLVSIYLM